MLSKFAAPVAALVSAVAAQSSCSFTATTVSAANDPVTSCTAISGDVMFTKGAASPMITLAAETIDGKLTYQGDETVTGFSAPKLTEVGNVNFNNLSSLNTISFMSLTKSGDFKVIGCGGLSTVTTGNTWNEAQNIMIQNTQLSALDAFTTLTSINSLNVNGNLLLANISMNIGKVKTIDVGNNEVANDGLSVIFNNLTQADTITVRNASTVSFKALGVTTGPMYFISNTFESFQLPNLTSAGTVQIQDNNKLTNISFPMLTALNQSNASLSITNNTALKTIGGFPMLTNIDGSLNFAGAFQNVTDISQLKKVSGKITVSSTEDIGDSVCPAVQSLYTKQVSGAKPVCSGKSKSAATNVGGSAGSGSGSSSGGSSTANAAAVDIPALPSLSAGLGVFLLQFLLSF